MSRIGRPTIYSNALAEEICRRLADGLSLRRVCEADDMPNRDTVRRWLGKREPFRRMYVAAREMQAEHFVDEVIEIADTDDNPTHARVRIDARKWAVVKLAPKKYGDKSEIEMSGSLDIANRLEKARRRLRDRDNDMTYEIVEETRGGHDGNET